MRISDWSSDVCSSDLTGRRVHDRRVLLPAREGPSEWHHQRPRAEVPVERQDALRQDLRQLPAGARDGLEEGAGAYLQRSEEHTSELQSLMRTSYAVFCLKKKKYKEHSTKSKRISQ